MQDRVLILGSTGLIGHQVHNYLKGNEGYELHNIAYRNKLQENTIAFECCNKIKELDPKNKSVINLLSELNS